MTEVSMTPEILQSLRESIASAIHCVLPGRVVSYDALAQTADIQPVLRRRGEDGVIYTMPVLKQVPVFLPAGSGFTVSPGDACLPADLCGLLHRRLIYETGEASRLTADDTPAILSYLSFYIMKSPSVLSVEDADITTENRRLTFSCHVITAEGSLPVKMKIST